MDMDNAYEVVELTTKSDNMNKSKYDYEADMFNAALKLKTHCNLQHRYRHGCSDCCFRNRENDDLINECPLSAMRPEQWDVYKK